MVQLLALLQTGDNIIILMIFDVNGFRYISKGQEIFSDYNYDLEVGSVSFHFNISILSIFLNF